ncbi:MAG: DUF2336 domain-containing protein [Bdellovibrionales bacterium]
MARDVEETVRRALAENLHSSPHLPHDIALRLAQDIETVAMPVLRHSPVLTNDDMIEIIRHGSPTKQEAIAQRPDVAQDVCDAIITSAGENAVAALMTNATAQIAEKSLGKAVERFADSDSVKEGMVRRKRLPVTITERLVTLVSENLKDYLVSHHELSPALAADLVLQSRERSVINLSAGSSTDEIEKLVLQMHMNERLTPSIILRALCMGDIIFFEVSIAVRTGISLVNARTLIHDAGSLGLKSICEKAGLPSKIVPAVRIALDVLEDTLMDGEPHDRERYRAKVIERVLTQYQDFGAEDIDYLLSKLGDVLSSA